MSLNAGKLAQAMLGAAKGKLGKNWPEIKEYARTEARKTAETLLLIEHLSVAGQINQAQAKALLRMQKASAQSFLLAVEGLGILTAEAAINAAVGAVKDSVNKAVGFVVI